MKNIILVLLVLLVFISGLYLYSTQKLDIYVSSPMPSTTTIQTIKENLQSANEKTAKCPNILVKSGEVLLLYNTTDTHDEMPIIFNSLDDYVNHIRIQRDKGIRCPVLFLEQENNIQGEDIFRIKSTPFNDYYNEPFSDLIGMTIPASSNGILSFPPSTVSKITAPSSTYMPFYNIEAFDGGMGSPAPASVSSPASAVVSSPASAVVSSPASAVVSSPAFNNTQSPYNKGGYPAFDPYGQTIGKYTNLDKIHDSTATPPLSDNPMDPNWGGTQYTKDAVDSGKYIENNVYPVNYSMPGSVQFYPGLHKTYPDPPNFVEKVGGPVPPYLQ